MSVEETRTGAGEQALEPSAAEGERRVVAPAVDIYEEDEALVIVADMPGATRDGVSAVVENGVLTIEGRVERPDSSEEVLYAEYEPADYRRSFTLGESVSEEGITASLSNGVLTVRLPKAERARTRKIEVKAE